MSTIVAAFLLLLLVSCGSDDSSSSPPAAEGDPAVVAAQAKAETDAKASADNPAAPGPIASPPTPLCPAGKVCKHMTTKEVIAVLGVPFAIISGSYDNYDRHVNGGWAVAQVYEYQSNDLCVVRYLTLPNTCFVYFLRNQTVYITKDLNPKLMDL